MRFRYQTYFVVLAMGIASSVCMADVPAMLKVRATPQLEALTAKYLLQLITEVSSEAGQAELAKSFDTNNDSISQSVLGLAALGRTEMALKYCAPEDQNRGGRITSSSMDEAFDEPPLLVDAGDREYVYNIAILRKVAYGKRTEARALVPKLKKPESRLKALMWLGAAALRDEKAPEAIPYLKDALKYGGPEAARHEWLGLLLARTGDLNTAKQIFKRRQISLESRKADKLDGLNEMLEGNWGSLCAAMWSAGFTNDALVLLKKHPIGAEAVFSVVVRAKASFQKQAALLVFIQLPSVNEYGSSFQGRALLLLNQQKPVANVDSLIGALEGKALKEVASLQKDTPVYTDGRLDILSGVVAAWMGIGKPQQGSAFLGQPSLELKSSERAAIESSALLTVARIRSQTFRSKAQSYNIPRAQTQELARQLAIRYRNFRFDEVWANSFSRVADGAIDLCLKAGDKPSAIVIAKATEKAIERNWRFSPRNYGPFLSEFTLLAARLQRIGDEASANKWLKRNPYTAQERIYGLGGYQQIEVLKAERTQIEFLQKKEAESKSEEFISGSFSDIRWREVVSAEAQVAVSQENSTAAKNLIPFPLWVQRLPLAARAQALPTFAQYLSSYNTQPSFVIRDSGWWESGE